MARPFKSIAERIRSWFTRKQPTIRHRPRLFIEQLEDRVVPSTYLVKDINTGTVGANPSAPTAGATSVLFAANDGVSGNELWRSDGTDAGTALVKDLSVGAGNSNPSNLTNINGTWFFANGADSNRLWKSDGTALGTVQVASNVSSITNLTNVNGTLFFVGAGSDGSGQELWKSDGSAVGTVRVKDIAPGSASSSPNNLFNYNGTLVFAANASPTLTGIELWKSDGTDGGTVLVKDIYTTSGNSSPSNFTLVGSTLFFTATDAVGGTELWRTDGSEALTNLVADLNAGASGSSPYGLAQLGNRLVFGAFNTSNQRELYVSDGTAAGTIALRTSVLGLTTPLFPSQTFVPTVVGNFAYFRSDQDGRLWKTDGTVAGTVRVSTTAVPQGAAAAAVGNTLFFLGNETATGTELWRSDGTEAGTVLVKDIFGGISNSGVQNLRNINGALYFTANDGSTGVELWRSDGTGAGTARVRDVNAISAASSPNGAVEINGVRYFAATDALGGTELWRTDGTEAQTFRVADINPGASGSNPFGLVRLGNKLVFGATNASNQRELYVSDGTVAGTVALRTSVLGLTTPLFPSQTFVPTVVGNFAYFRSDQDGRLWKTDGTVAGTVRVSTTAVPQGAAAAAVGNMLFFLGNETATGNELWRSDGTEAGTVLVKDIFGGTASSTIQNLRSINGALYFTATDPSFGAELWTSDGTEAGTVLVHDANAISAGSFPASLVDINGVRYFVATDALGGTELWRTDGTEAQTFRVADISPGASGSSPFGLARVGNKLVFGAFNASNQRELYVSDGTAAGTVALRTSVLGLTTPLFPSQSFVPTVVGNFAYFRSDQDARLWKSDGTVAGTVRVSTTAVPQGAAAAAVGNMLFFLGNETATGNELWRSDGTDAGTVLVKDIFGGTASSTIQNLRSINGALYFTATDPSFGAELWTSNGASAGTFVVSDVFSGPAGSSPSAPVGVGAAVYWSANDGINGQRLYRNEAGVTTVIANGANASNLTAVGSTLYFTRSGQLWKTDGSDAVQVSTAVSSIGNMMAGPGPALYFSGNGSDGSGMELWKSDGVSTVRVADIVAGSGSSSPVPLLNSGGLLFFSATDPVFGTELWQTDGTTTSRVKDINNATASSSPSAPVGAGAAVYWTANDGINGTRLYRSAAGVTTVIANSASALNLTAVGSTLYFTRSGQLWKTDGGDATQVSTAVSNIANLMAGPGAAVYFAGFGSDNSGNELWKSDGTAPGTSRVADLAFGSASSSPAPLLNSGGVLFFTADDGIGGRELWVTDGQPGTRPIAYNQFVTVQEDGAQAITLVAQDSENDPLTFEIVSGPTHGVLTGTGANRTYAPSAEYSGPDSFTFRVFDGHEYSNSATVSITVVSVNDVPVANGVFFGSFPEDTSLTRTLTGSDRDGDQLTFHIDTHPTHGVVVLNPVSGEFTYTPDRDYFGSDTFLFTVSDAQSTSQPAQVFLLIDAVPDLPTAVDDEFTTSEDTPVSGNVLTNDFDVDHDPLIVAGFFSAGHGVVAIFANGNFTYTPTLNYNGPDSFIYEIQDGHGPFSRDFGTVNLIVNAVNDPPVANAGTDQAAIEGATVTFNGSATDVEGDAITYAWDFGAGATGTGPNPTHTYAEDGVYTATLTATDSHGASHADTMKVTVANAPPFNLSLTLSPIAINEGGGATLGGSFNDPGTLDTHTVTVNWGDGSANTVVNLPAGVTSFSGITHTYADNRSPNYLIQATVADEDNAAVNATTTIVVNNVAPTLTISGASSVNEGSTYTLNLSATDPGADTITSWSINWGDGSTEIVPGNPSSATHTYTDGTRSFTILATATDEDGIYEAKASGGNAVVSVDPTFGVNGEFRKDFFGSTADYVQSMRVLSNGKVVVAGQTQGGNSNIGLARYHADGTIDTTFGTNGKVITEFGGDEVGAALLVDALGRLLVGGYQGLSRYSADGVLDTTFGINGKLTTFTGINALVLDSLGRIVASNGNSVIRLDANGSVDQSFNGGNSAYYGNHLYGQGLTVDSLDRPVIAGSYYDNTANTSDIRTVRFTSAGALDAAFGAGGADGNGVVTINFGGRNDYANRVAIHQGKILIAGQTDPVYDNNLNQYQDPAGNNRLDGDLVLAQLNDDGTLDTAFGVGGPEGNGLVQAHFGGSQWDSAYALAVTASNEILVAGTLGGNYAWARFSSAGVLDTTVGAPGTPGRAPTLFPPQVIAQDASGRVLIGGYRNAAGGEGSNFAVARYAANGSLDATFGVGGADGNGVVSTDFQGSTADYVSEFSLTLPDGKVLIAGHKDGGVSELVLARLNANGALDTTFGASDADGINGVAIDGRYSYPSALTLDNNGKILVAVNSILLRYNADGTPDNSFGPGASNDASSSIQISDLAVDASGRIIAGGYRFNSSNNSSDFALTRFTATGALDTSYGTTDGDGINGVASLDLGSSAGVRSEEYIFDIALDSAGKIVAAGYSYAYQASPPNNTLREGDFAVARFNTDGSVDTTFGVGASLNHAGLNVIENLNGVAFIDFGSWENPNALAIDSAGRILVGGYGRLARLTATGTLDAGFDGDGKVFASGDIQMIALDASGRIVTGGSQYLNRYQDNGAPDTTFAPGGQLFNSTRFIYDLALDSSGRIIVGGYTSSAGSTGTDMWVSRYLTGGLAVNVLNVAPQNVAITGPTSASEGDTINLSATATDPAGIHDPLIYTWSITRNGAAFLQVSGQAISFAAPDNGSYTATVTVDDGDGGLTNRSHTINVGNVAPQAAFTAPASVAEGSLITVSLTSPTDVSSVDAAAGFTYAFDLGAGYGAFTSSNSASVTALDDGTRTVKGKIRDKDNGEREYTATVLVTNVPPTLSNLAVSSAINENGSTTLTGVISDPGTLDTFTMSINWGDPLSPNNVQTLSLGNAEISTPGLTWVPNKLGMLRFSGTIDDGEGTIAAGALFSGEIIYDITQPNPGDPNSQFYTYQSGRLTIGGVETSFGSQQLFIENDGSFAGDRVVFESGPFTLNGLSFTHGRLLELVDTTSNALGSANIPFSTDLGAYNFERILFFAASGDLRGQLSSLSFSRISTFAVTHQYLDDNPSGTSQDTYAVAVNLDDDDGGAATPTPASGLLSWWQADGSAADSLGTNPGTLFNGAGFGPGKIGQAFEFDGADDYFQASTLSLPTGNSDRTLALWVRMDNVVAAQAYFAAYGTVGSFNQLYALGAEGTTPFFSQWGEALFGPALQLGQWYHMAVTNVGNLATLYIDGVAVDTGNLNINTSVGTPMIMGRAPGFLGASNRLDGAVDDVQVYNRALTASEIAGIYVGNSRPVTVKNIPPEFEAGASETLNPPQVGAFSRTGISFTDPGTLDVWSGTVNFGDGTGNQPLVIDQLNKTFDLNHTYTSEGTFPVTVTLKDDDGGVEVDTFQNTVFLNTPPTIDVDHASVTTFEGTPAVNTGTFADAQGNSSVTLSASVGAVLWNSAAGTWSWSAPAPEGPAGPTSVTITATDNYGETATANFTFRVDNVRPSDLNLSLSAASISENDSTTLGGSFTDPGTLDTHTVTINWGDGSVNTVVNLAAGVTSFAGVSHQYLDDSPTGANSDSYTIHVMVSDDEGGSTSAATDVAVNNVAPSSLSLNLTATTIDENGSTTLGGSFTDPGSLDTHTVTINWGDGSAVTVVNLAASVLSFSDISHQYLDDGASPGNGTIADLYTISVTVTDDDGGATVGNASVLVQNVAPGLNSAAGLVADSGTSIFVSTLAESNGEVFFVAYHQVDGTYQLWKTGAAPGDEIQLTSFAPLGMFGFTFIADFTVFDGELYFTADDGVHGRELWKTNGTVAGTQLVIDLNTSAANPSASPYSLKVVGNSLYFAATDDNFANKVWRLDANDTVALVADPSGESIFVSTLAELNGEVFFVAFHQVDGTYQLWKTGAAPGDEIQLTNFAPLGMFAFNFISEFTVFDGELYFTADDGVHGRELWKTDGAVAGTQLVIDLNTSAANPSASPSSLRVVGNSLYFAATNDASVNKIWRLDASDAVALVADPGPALFVSTLAELNGALYFVAYHQADGTQQLWKAGAAPGDETQLTAFAPVGMFGFSFISDLTVFDGELYFTADDGVHGRELWKTDGAAAGTQLVVDLNTSAANPSASPYSLRVVGDRLYFAATDDVFANKIWRLGGSALQLDTSAVNEDGTVTLSGTFTDAGTLDVHTVTISWGEGAPEIHVLPLGARSFSFSHQYLDDNPSATDADLFSISVTIGDDDGGSVTGNTSVTVNNVAPEIRNVSATPSAIDEDGTIELSFEVFDVGTLDTRAVTIDWGDGALTGYPLGLAPFFIVAQHRYEDDNASDNYTILITAMDDDGDTTTFSQDVTVHNAAPANLRLSFIASTINENGSATLNGTFHDPGTLDTHTIVIDWNAFGGAGEGTTTITTHGHNPTGTTLAYLGNGNWTFSASHQYLDDNPTGTGADLYAVGVRLTDDDGGTNTGSTTITVANVDPVIDTLAATSVFENGIARLTGTYHDVGTQDTHTLTINWGEGAPQTVVVSGGSFDITHQYLDDNATGTSSDVYNISATLRDDDGGADTKSTTTTITNVDPAIDTLAATSVFENGVVHLTGSYHDDGALDTHTLTINWGEGDPQTVVVTGGSFDITHQYLESGVYTISATLTDDDTGADAKTTTTTITNLDPVIDTLAATSVLENGVVHLTGTYHDAGTQDTHTLTINWGEGDPQTVVVTGGSFDFTHQYRDDNPTATGFDVFAISATLTDDDAGAANSTATTTITNAAPVLGGLTNSSPDCGGAFMGQDVVTIAAAFTDVGTLDTHTVSINWGDGHTTAGTLVESAGNGTVAGSHIYATGGIFTITVTLTDDDGGTSVAATTATVGGVGLTPGGELQIIGTEGKDIIHLVRVQHSGDSNGPTVDQIRVHALFNLPGGSDGAPGGDALTFNTADVHGIRIILCCGDDYAQVDHDIFAPAYIDGGEGNDHILSGAGNDTIVDMFGDNVIHAGAGNDTVSTGAGNDRIWGDAGNDTIDAGAGANEVRGEDGDDGITTGAGADKIWGGAGNDSVDAGNGNNSVYGDDGADSIVTGTGADRIEAGAGNDIVWAGAENDAIDGGAGNDVLLGGAGNDTIVGGDGRDLLIGGFGADTLTGSKEDDILIADMTAFDADAVALASIMNEWSSSRTYAQRVYNLTNGTAGGSNSAFASRANGDTYLIGDDGAAQSVFNDLSIDTLTGNQGSDLFFANQDGSGGSNGPLDVVTKDNGETVADADA